MPWWGWVLVVIAVVVIVPLKIKVWKMLLEKYSNKQSDDDE
jgi:hypothetical protein